MHLVYKKFYLSYFRISTPELAQRNNGFISQLARNSSLVIHSYKEVVKPLDGLVEGLLLGKLLVLLGNIATDGETMHDARVQVDLVGLANFLEDLLAAVALLAGEDGIGLGGGDGQRSLKAAELVLVNK